MKLGSGDIVTVNGLGGFQLNAASFVSLAVHESEGLLYPRITFDCVAFTTDIANHFLSTDFSYSIMISDLVYNVNNLKSTLLRKDGLKSYFRLSGIADMGMETARQNALMGNSTDAMSSVPVPLDLLASTDDHQVWLQHGITDHMFLKHCVDKSKSVGEALYAAYTNMKARVVDPLMATLEGEFSNFQQGIPHIIDYYLDSGDPVDKSKFLEVHPPTLKIKDLTSVKDNFPSKLNKPFQLDNANAHPTYQVQEHYNASMKTERYVRDSVFVHPGYHKCQVLSKASFNIKDSQSGELNEAFTGEFFIKGRTVVADPNSITTILRGSKF